MNTPETINIEKYAEALNNLIGVDSAYMAGDKNVDAIAEVIVAAKKLENRVKELAEENERLQDLITETQQYNEAWVEDNGKLRQEIKKLRESECDHCACELLDERDEAREEAERYKKYYFHHEYDQWEAEIKADTVRKMQERLKHECLIDSGYEVLQIGTIDQIAKEVLEENK